MKNSILFALVPLALTISSARAGEVNINLDVSGEVAPGVYGHVSIGDSHPHVVYDEPVIIHETNIVKEPVYLHVPPEHARHWERYCESYHACDRRVYFVRSSEYRGFKDEHRHVHEERYEEREERHEERKEEHREDEHEHEHGHDHGYGHDDHD